MSKYRVSCGIILYCQTFRALPFLSGTKFGFGLRYAVLLCIVSPILTTFFFECLSKPVMHNRVGKNFWHHSPFRGKFSHNLLTQCNFLPPQKNANPSNQNFLQWVTNHVFLPYLLIAEAQLIMKNYTKRP